MYEKHFGLSRNPFLLTPDPRYLYLTAEHREALAGLVYSIVQRKGFAILTGDAGTGKTTLVRAVLHQIPEGEARVSLVFHPTLSVPEFLEMILLEFGIKDVPSSKARRLVRLQEFLLHNHSQGKTVVLIVDEAHKLSVDVLEEIRLLTNLETSEGKLLQIVLAAQPELDSMLSQPELRQLKQRIGYRFTVRPLAAQEIVPYMRFRWTQGGGAENLPFTEDASDYLALFSGGIPRVINAICDNALLVAFSAGLHEVYPEHIVVAAKELALREGEPPVGASPAPAHSLAISAAAGAAHGQAHAPESAGERRVPPARTSSRVSGNALDEMIL